VGISGQKIDLFLLASEGRRIGITKTTGVGLDFQLLNLLCELSNIPLAIHIRAGM